MARSFPPVAVDIVPGLSLLVAGATAPHPQELLSSKEFLNLSQNAQRNYGVVIYDTPAALENADAYVVASRVGSAILLGRRNRFRRRCCLRRGAEPAIDFAAEAEASAPSARSGRRRF